jgi:hypothetical protein
VTAIRTITRIQDADDLATPVDGEVIAWHAASSSFIFVSAGGSGVSSFNTRSGAVTLTSGDVTAAVVGLLRLPGAISSSLQAASDGAGTATSAFSLATNNVLVQTLNSAGMPDHPPPGATQAAGGFRSYLNDNTTSVTLIGMATSNNVEIYPLAQGQLIFFGSAGYAGGPSPTMGSSIFLRAEDPTFSQNMQVIGTQVQGGDTLASVCVGDFRNIVGNVQGDCILGLKSGTFRFRRSGAVDSVTEDGTNFIVWDQSGTAGNAVLQVGRSSGNVATYGSVTMGAHGGTFGFNGGTSALGEVSQGVAVIKPIAGSGSAWFQNTGGEGTLANAFTKTNATFANTNLSYSLIAGRTYRIEGYLLISNSTAGEGGKIDFNGGGATATAMRVDVITDVGTSSPGTQSSTSLAGVINWTSISGTNVVRISGYITCGNAGTLVLRAAENSTSTGTFTLGAGSWIALSDTVNL